MEIHGQQFAIQDDFKATDAITLEAWVYIHDFSTPNVKQYIITKGKALR